MKSWQRLLTNGITMLVVTLLAAAAVVVAMAVISAPAWIIQQLFFR